jgi:hypothetical protein
VPGLSVIIYEVTINKKYFKAMYYINLLVVSVAVIISKVAAVLTVFSFIHGNVDFE